MGENELIEYRLNLYKFLTGNTGLMLTDLQRLRINEEIERIGEALRGTVGKMETENKLQVI